MFYTISEVSEMLSESVSCIRFWSNSFPKKIKPHRTAKGNRQFKAEDIEVLRQIQYLVKVQGLTLEGAAKALDGDTVAVSRKVRALETLKGIRAQLVEIRESL